MTDRRLQRGDKGPDVRELQVWLSLHWGARLKADGILGSLTETCLKRWQAASGLDAEGVMDEESWAEYRKQDADFLGRIESEGGWMDGRC